MSFAKLFASRFLTGQSFVDWESSRETARMQAAGRMAEAAGARRTFEHDGNTDGFDWATRRPRHQCSADCTVSYPAWVTAEWLQAIYPLANAAVTEQGKHTRLDTPAAQRSLLR